MTKKYCYFNGKIIEEKDAHINPYDLGMLRGYAVFDVMCTTNGKPFRLHDHWRRLCASAKELRFVPPITKKDFEKNVTELLARTPYVNTSIRTVLSGGPSANGMTLGDTPTFFILLHDADRFMPDPKLYTTGATLITHDFTRHNPLSKTTAYVEAIKYQKLRNQKKAIEILYTSGNTVLECSTGNIFIVKNNTLITPRENILNGITRKVVIELAQKNGITVKQQKITRTQLEKADEVFITGSLKHILPITHIDAKAIGVDTPGPFTRLLSELYMDYFTHY